MTPKSRAALARRKIAAAERAIIGIGELYQDIDNSIYEQCSMDDFWCNRLEVLKAMVEQSHDQEEKFTLLRWGQ